MTSEKEIEAGEHTETPLASRGEKLKRHFSKRWWIWLIGALTFLFILIIIIIFAIIPAVAQKTLDDTTLHSEYISILDPTPNTFSLSMLSRITGGGKTARRAKLDPMDVSFSLDHKAPFLTVPMPSIKGGDNTEIEKLNYTVTIQDADAFLEFAKTLIASEEFSIGLNGKTKLRIGSLKMNVKYRQTVTLKGLNKLKGMEITNYTLLNQTDYNLRGEVVIPNPSVFTIQTGNVPLTIGYNGTSLGTGVLSNLTLAPGLDNKYEFMALLDTEKLTNALPVFIFGNGVLQVGATAAYFNNVNIPWLSTPLESLTSNVKVKGIAGN